MSESINTDLALERRLVGKVSEVFIRNELSFDEAVYYSVRFVEGMENYLQQNFFIPKENLQSDNIPSLFKARSNLPAVDIGDFITTIAYQDAREYMSDAVNQIISRNKNSDIEKLSEDDFHKIKRQYEIFASLIYHSLVSSYKVIPFSLITIDIGKFAHLRTATHSLN